MVDAERKLVVTMEKFEHFGETMSDGRLTEPSDGKSIVLEMPSTYQRG